MAVCVRPATAADATVLAELSRALNSELREPVGHVTDAAVARDVFGASPAGISVLLAELDGRPVGYALFHDAYESTYAARGVFLGDLYVRPEARRHGVGRALVAAVARAAKARDRSFVWWVSKAWNADAHAFYRTLGALDEPVVAHALTFGAFEALAAEAEPDGPAGGTATAPVPRG